MKTIQHAQKFIFSLVLGISGGVILPVALGGASYAQAASTAGLPDFADLVEKTGPAVINIRTTERVKPGQGGGAPGAEDEEMQEFFRRFFGVPIPRQQPAPPRGRRPAPQQEEEVPRGVGSGFIISADGF